MVVIAILTGATCPGPNGDGASTTRPAPPRRKWPGTTGQVNRLVVWLSGTGPVGFALVVNTMQMDRRGAVKFVVEDGSFTFRLYPADPLGKPMLKQAMGEWNFDEAATRRHWSPGGWGRDATFTFPLRWQGPVPPPRTELILITEFKPHGRDTVVTHRLAFTVQAR